MADLLSNVFNNNGLVIMVYGKGILEGPVKTEKEDKETIELKYHTKDEKGDLKLIVRNVEINHRSRLTTVITKRIELLPYQAEAMVSDCPSNINPIEWKRMNPIQKFEKSLSLFDEGYGIEYEFIF